VNNDFHGERAIFEIFDDLTVDGFEDEVAAPASAANGVQA
jgi:hypothetical protein